MSLKFGNDLGCYMTCYYLLLVHVITYYWYMLLLIIYYWFRGL